MKYRLDELSVIKRGGSPRPITDYLANEGLPWLKISDFNYGERYVYNSHEFIIPKGLNKTKLVKKNTLIVTNSATPGIPIFLGKDMCLHDGFLYFESISDKVLPMYLYYFLLKQRDFLKSQGNGSIFINLKKEILERTIIDLPDIENQNHIVNTIGTIDDLIENITNQNIKILEIVEKIFSNLNESDIMLKDLCEIKYGKSITASKLDNNGKYTVYGGNGIIGTLDDYMFDKSKISISCRGAAAGNVLLTTSFSTISSNSLYLNLYDESLTLPLYAFLLKARLNNYVTGSAQPQITIENIKFLKVPIFDDYKNDNFNYIIDLINNNIEKLNKLNLIKQNLLSKYF